MTSSADSLLADWLGYTLAGCRPATDAAARGGCAKGVRWQWLDEGVLRFEPAQVGRDTRSVLLSAGVHGDETAPIEMLSRMVAEIAQGRVALASRLLVVLGNVGAMRAGTRYLDDDLNRLFGGRHERMPASREAQRAAALERVARAFFADAPEHPSSRWHWDLHTAIRASVFEQFALLPHTDGRPSGALLTRLADARLAAVLTHTEKGATCSQFTADACGALACTLELGKVRPFGQNDLSRFAAADAAIRRLVGGAQPDRDAPMPRRFDVVAQITKQTDAFELLLAPDVPNFTPFARGTLLARDGEFRYVVRHDEERIVFPNASVKPGLRAGLLVVETTRDTAVSPAVDEP